MYVSTRGVDLSLAETTKPSGGGFTVIPEEEPDTVSWIQENPEVIAVIVVAVVVLIIVLMFCYVRRKRLAASRESVDLNCTEKQVPETQPGENNDASAPDRDDNVFAESFVIIRSPNLPSHSRMHQKRKSTLAVPPLFSVSNKRKSAPNIYDGLKPPVVGWTRWSSAGLEIHTSPPPRAPAARGNPVSREMSRKKRRQSTPGILMAVPVVYRRVSHAQNHAVYQPEHIGASKSTLPQRPKTP